MVGEVHDCRTGRGRCVFDGQLVILGEGVDDTYVKLPGIPLLAVLGDVAEG